MTLPTGVALAAGVLATFRLTELLNNEVGPFEILLRVREFAGRWDGVAQALACFWCLSMWTGGAVALVLTISLGWPWWMWLLATLALSGGAVIINGITEALDALEDFLRDSVNRKEGN